MKKPVLVGIVAAGLLLSLTAWSAPAETHTGRAKSSHAAARVTHKTRHRARVYNVSNTPTRAYSRKSSSFVPNANRNAKRQGAATKKQASRRAADVSRTADGRIARSTRARDEFRQDRPCPSTGWTTGSCPGYVVDHVKALKHGGADAPNNMQWQTSAAAKAKDRVE